MSTLRLILVAGMSLLASSAFAHVPYIESRDHGLLTAFRVKDPAQSIVSYSWLESADDIDFYRMELVDETRVFVESIVPVCPGYADFKPSFAIVAPGLPEPTAPLPFPLPQGWGAIVNEDVGPGEPRETFFEPFGGKSYYQGPRFDEPMPAGTYWVVYWDPYGATGDYGAVIGFEEEFPLPDLLRALVNTPKIRRNEELHVPCD